MLSPGNLPHSSLQPLSSLLADKTVVGILCLRGYKRNLSRLRSSLRAADPHVSSFHGPRRPLQQVHLDIALTSRT